MEIARVDRRLAPFTRENSLEARTHSQHYTNVATRPHLSLAL